MKLYYGKRTLFIIFLSLFVTYITTPIRGFLVFYGNQADSSLNYFGFPFAYIKQTQQLSGMIDLPEKQIHLPALLPLTLNILFWFFMLYIVMFGVMKLKKK